jgi:hypothetical protein
MKKNKGFMMGIAALALLFSMAFLGCESATGAAGDPGDGRDLAQNFTITPAQKIVVPDGSTGWEFYPWYGGINITTKDQIVWSVTGDDLDSTSPGFKDAGTTIVPSLGTGNGVLTVAVTEKSVYLTVTASYGGYLVSEKVEVGVPYLTGPSLIPGVEIGTTNVSWIGYTGNNPISSDKPDSTYVVYTIDPKEVTAVSRTAKIPLEATVKVNTSVGPTIVGVDYDIPLPQDKWLTIYEVPLATGATTDGHTTILGFKSMQAVESNAPADVHVNLPMLNPVGDGPTTLTYPFLTPGALGTGLVTYSSSNLKGKTGTENGGYDTTYTAYLVYYSKYDPITGELLPNVDDYVPALNSVFVPSGDFVNVNKTAGDTVYLNRTGDWYYILQYTGTAPGTGNGAWAYVKADGSGYNPNPVIGVTTVNVQDVGGYTATVIKPEGAVNTVHIGLSGDRTFVDEVDLQLNQATYFNLASGYVQVTRDSDTGVTLYLQNGDRTTLSTLTSPTFTISEAAFKRGAKPRVVTENGFITVSGSDMKYSDIVVSGQTQAGITFTAGTATQITVASGTTPVAFPIGNLENTYNEEAIGTIQWNISWYYVNGSNWVSTGTPNGNTFTPLEEDKGKTIGIRVDAEGNFPDVTLVEVTSLGGIDKWNYIGYGQRILGAVTR